MTDPLQPLTRDYVRQLRERLRNERHDRAQRDHGTNRKLRRSAADRLINQRQEDQR